MTVETCYLVDQFLLSSGTLDYAWCPKEISGIAVLIICSSTCGLPRERAYVRLCRLSVPSYQTLITFCQVTVASKHCRCPHLCRLADIFRSEVAACCARRNKGRLEVNICDILCVQLIVCGLDTDHNASQCGYVLKALETETALKSQGVGEIYSKQYRSQ